MQIIKTFEIKNKSVFFGKVVDKIFLRRFCLINQLQTILKTKLIFKRILALRVKSKAFKTKPEPKYFWFENTWSIEK